MVSFPQSRPAQDSSTPIPQKLARRLNPLPSDNIPSSSPAFATPLQPIRPPANKEPIQPPAFKPTTVLPINLPVSILRPVACRVFKRYNLVLQTPALLALATFIGKNCGTGWKDQGLAEGVLEEVAKTWKKQSNGSLVSNDGDVLKNILKTVESCMSGGRITSGKGLSRQSSFAFGEGAQQDALPTRPSLQPAESFGISRLEIAKESDEEDILKDPREWIKVIDAFDQPRMIYDTTKKHFER